MMIQNVAFLPRLAVRLSAFVPEGAAADAAFMTQLTCLLTESGIDLVLNDTGYGIATPFCQVITGSDVTEAVLPLRDVLPDTQYLILTSAALSDSRLLHDDLQSLALKGTSVWFEAVKTDDVSILAGSLQVQQILLSAGLAQACLKEGVVSAVRNVCAVVAKARAKAMQGSC